MFPRVLDHALMTTAMLALLWVIPVAVVLVIAAVASSWFKRLRKRIPPPIHFPNDRRTAA